MGTSKKVMGMNFGFDSLMYGHGNEYMELERCSKVTDYQTK